jgi:hypothetical protein
MECGCTVIRGHWDFDGNVTDDSIVYCPKHAAADAMLEALKKLYMLEDVEVTASARDMMKLKDAIDSMSAAIALAESTDPPARK